MTETQKTVAVVAVVAVVIIAGVGVYFLAGNNNNYSAEKLDSKLLICGNANEDLVLDADDTAIIQDIIDRKENMTLENYPMADANNDGKVTNADLTLVNDLIAGNKTTVYIQCLDYDGNSTVVAADYPLRNVVPFGTNIVEPFLYVGGGQYVAGYFTSSYDNLEYSMSAAIDLGGSARKISDSAWQNFNNLDATCGGVGALLIDISGVSQFTDSYRSGLADAQIPVIIYAPADQMQEIGVALTLGFLCGKTTEALGLSYAKLSLEVYKAIQGKVSAVSDDDKASVINFTMGIYVCQNDSTFNQSSSYIGAVPYYKINSDFATVYAGSNSVKMQSVEALADYDNASCLVSNRSLDVGQTDTAAAWVEMWDKYVTYFQDLDDYHGLVYINNLLPGACKLAYLAAAAYPELFSDDWANGVMQDFIDGGFTSLEGQTLDTIPTSFDYDDYIAANA
ncbi:MAG: hypothetical protein WCQ63_05410 [Methanomethylophilus sp.]